MENSEARPQVSTFCFVLYIYFIIDYFVRFSARIPAYGKISPTVILFLLITISLFLQRDKFKEDFQDPLFKVVLALIIYIVLSTPLVEWPGSVIRTNWQPFVKAVSFFFFTALIIDSNKRLRIFLFVFIACQLVRVLEPLFLNLTTGYLGGSTYVGGGEFAGRLAGAPADVVNPNGLGFVIATLFPFLYYIVWFHNFKWKLFCLLSMPALFYAMILTMSRGAFITLSAGAVLAFIYSKHQLIFITFIICIALIGWNIMSPIQKERYLSLFSGNTMMSDTVEGRIDTIFSEFKLGFERPIVGHGLGTTSEAKYHRYGITQASHNFYGQLLIEIGIIGFIIFFVYVFNIYTKLKENTTLFKSSNTSSKDFLLFQRLNVTFKVVFLMYAIYSLNYFGLSQYYWYMFGGFIFATNKLLRKSHIR
jgi:hypothetical protein